MWKNPIAEMARRAADAAEAAGIPYAFLFKLLPKHERSLWDAKTVFDAQPGLDRDYVRETAARLHVTDRWQRLLEAAGAGEEKP